MTLFNVTIRRVVIMFEYTKAYSEATVEQFHKTKHNEFSLSVSC